MRKIALLLLVIVALLALPALPLSSAIACPTYTTSHSNGYTFTVQVTGHDGSCPSTYCNSGTIHYVLSTSASANPYTIILTGCIPGTSESCPPSVVTFQGWTLSGITTVCKSTGTACTSTIAFNVDATVQADESCNTLNVKAGGDVILILEAGVGGDCSGTSTTSTTTKTTSTTSTTATKTTSTITTTSSTVPGVPQFGASFGMLMVIALVAPMLLLLRKFSLSAGH